MRSFECSRRLEATATFMIDAADAIPIWSPLVIRFLDQYQ